MTTTDRIFELMHEHNMNAKQFAELTGISQGNVTDWKKGRSKPSIKAIEKIANNFNVSIDYLLGNTNKTSYVETLIRYLKPLNLTNDEFELFKEISIAFLNKVAPNVFSQIIRQNNKKNISSEKILYAFDIIADLADDFESKAQINKVTHMIEKYKELLYNDKFTDANTNTDIDSYEYLIENINIDDIVKNGLINALQQLNKKLIVTNEPSHFYMLPLYGEISAGLPNWADECMEGKLPIDPNLMNILNPEEYYFLRVNGESMNKIVKNGAFALIHKQDYVDNGEIAVVLVDGENATLKHFSKKGNIIVLTPDSDDETFEQQIYTKDTPVKVIGKYVGKMEINK